MLANKDKVGEGRGKKWGNFMEFHFFATEFAYVGQVACL